MQKVKNAACIRRLSQKTLRTAKLRNVIAVFAIALTTMLFSSLFTIGLSITKSFEQQSFRQVGGNFHGGFKDITPDQIQQLSSHPLIKSYGLRMLIGMPEEVPFLKSHVEVSYADANEAAALFCIPKEGRLPMEGTLEAATDTRVLKLLGVEPKVGETFTITFDRGVGTGINSPVTQTFTLCGWWEYDNANIASHVLVPLTYAKEALLDYEGTENRGNIAGRWDMSVFFNSSLHIGEDLSKVLEDYGYQNENELEENYIGTGINWAYTGAQLSDSMDMGNILGIAAAFILVVFTGYLIIYNIFRISVTGDIRYYGLLKTIGTTGQQIRRLISSQAVVLSCIGIPAGLIFGWLFGAVLTPVVMRNLSYKNTVLSQNPLIFAGAAAFSFCTVQISVRRPARAAGRVSPVEAVRYTEIPSCGRKEKKSEGGSRIYRMALANLGRSRSKTCLVILSLALAVVLLNVTFIFAGGFNMDKYLEKYVCTDFIVGHADYFQSRFRSADNGVTEVIIDEIDEQGGIRESGRIYGKVSDIREFLPETRIREKYAAYSSAEELDQMIRQLGKEADEKGRYPNGVQVYGMEELPLSRLEVTEGDLSKLEEDGGDYIVAVVDMDDYGNPLEESNSRQIGEQIRIRYADEMRAVDSRTGKPAQEDTPDEYIINEVGKYHDKVYTVCARVMVNQSMGYRYSFAGQQKYVLGAEEFKRETGTAAVMSYLMNMEDDSAAETMEAFLQNYTENREVGYDFESKESYSRNFYSLRSMFVLLGGALSGVIAVIGILNFINAVVTGVISRRREFAMLQAVGMTGRQLKEMLILEGCSYGIGAILTALILNVAMAPVIGNVLAGMFWFFVPHFTMTAIGAMAPLFILSGVLIPMAACHFMKKESIVDRIRDVE